MRISSLAGALALVCAGTLAYATGEDKDESARPVAITPKPVVITPDIADLIRKAIPTPPGAPAPENPPIIVDDNGAGDYLTINPAVAAATPGDTIIVLPGLYIEDVVVDRKVTIVGAGTSSNPAIGTILRGASVSPALTVVTVTGDDVTLTDMLIDGVQPVYLRAKRGVLGAAVDSLSVIDCLIKDCITGIAYVDSARGLFVRNEILNFGKDLSDGGAIHCFNSTSTKLDTNYAHDGASTGFIYNAGSSGLCVFNVAEGLLAGFLSNSSKPVVFLENLANQCNQGYQSVGDQAIITYRENVARGCMFGFVLFGLGNKNHFYLDNKYQGDGTTVRSIGFYFTTGSPFGDSDCKAVCKGNAVVLAERGVVFEETLTSKVPFKMLVSWNGTGNPNMLCDNLLYDMELVTCDDPVDATNNYWCTKIEIDVKTRILDFEDDASLGLVTISPVEFTGVPYCVGKLNSANCVADIAAIGGPAKATGPALPFVITATEVRNNKAGYLLTSVSGAASTPFLGGTLCVALPVRRQPVSLTSGGNFPPAKDCSGSYSFDMRARILSTIDPTLVAGATVNCQWIYRDGGVSFAAAFTDAISFVICP